jgi:hypothetical protein
LKERKPNQRSGYYIGIGLVLGAGIGAALDNVGMGVALGVAIGAALDTLPKNDDDDSSP